VPPALISIPAGMVPAPMTLARLGSNAASREVSYPRVPGGVS